MSRSFYNSHFKGKGGGTSIQAKEESHIFKDPPKSKHTRKKERVELGDVTYNLRYDDVGRFDNSLGVFNKNANPSVKVEYQNHGNYGGIHKTIQAKSPYKVNENFRPPMRTLEDNLPLSRQKRTWVAGTTNPGAGEYGVIKLADQYDRSVVDKVTSQMKKEIYVAPNPSMNVAQPEAREQIKLTDLVHADVQTNPISYNISLDDIEPVFKSKEAYLKDRQLIEIVTNPNYNKFEDTREEIEIEGSKLKSSANTNPISYPSYDLYREFQKEKTNGGLLIKPYVQANLTGLSDTDDYRGEKVGSIKSKLLKQLSTEINPNASLVYYDSDTHDYLEVKSHIKDRLNIMAQAAVGYPLQLDMGDGEKSIKLRDYNWKIVQTTPTQQVFIIEPKDVQLTKRLGSYGVDTHPSGHKEQFYVDESKISLNSREMRNVDSNPSGYKEEFYRDESKISLPSRESYEIITPFSGMEDTPNHEQIEGVRFKRTPTNIEPNVYNGTIPMIQEGQDPTLRGSLLRKKAGDEFFGRFSNELDDFKEMR